MSNIEEMKNLTVQSRKKLGELNLDRFSEHQILAVKFWEKFIKNNEGLGLLINENYIAEAFVVYRLSMEHIFNMFALLREPSFLERLKNDSDINRTKALNDISKNEARYSEKTLTVENSQLLKDALDKYNKNPVKSLGYSVYNASQASELRGFYASVYRVVSLFYSHSTFASVAMPANESDIDDLILNSIDFQKMAYLLVEKELQ